MFKKSTPNLSKTCYKLILSIGIIYITSSYVFSAPPPPTSRKKEKEELILPFRCASEPTLPSGEEYHYSEKIIIRDCITPRNQATLIELTILIQENKNTDISDLRNLINRHLNQGGTINDFYNDETLLHLAIRSVNVRAVLTILEFNPDNIVNLSNVTPLQLARDLIHSSHHNIPQTSIYQILLNHFNPIHPIRQNPSVHFANTIETLESPRIFYNF